MTFRSLSSIVTYLNDAAAGAVVIAGSHAAVYTTYLTAKAGARAAIQHDGGVGRDQAGVGGLVWAENLGMAMAAVSGRTARIGDGEDMLQHGVIGHANRLAVACGVVAGMPCRDAGERLRATRLPHTRPTPMSETRGLYEAEAGSRPILYMDSIALAKPDDHDAIIGSGSHAGIPSAKYAQAVGMKLALFNDAGIGVDDSGIAALPLLQRAGIAAATVSALSARIGDGRSTLHDGVISALNAAARELGGRVDMPALELARMVARME